VKKIFAVFMVVCLVLSFVACGKEELPEGYVTYTDVVGVSFIAPEEVIIKGADNEKFRNLLEEVEDGEKVELSGTYLYEDEENFGYMDSKGLLILVSPNEGLMGLQTVYDNDEIPSYVEQTFPVKNVSTNAKTIVNLGQTTLSAPIKASVSVLGKMSGYFVGVEKGFNNSNILVLVTESYMEKNAKEVEKLIKSISQSLTFVEE